MAFITYGHHALINGNRDGAIKGSYLTIILAILFTGLQYYEYAEAAFTFSDSVYGTVFFASTGLHGFIAVPILIILPQSWSDKFNSLTFFHLQRQVVRSEFKLKILVQ